MKLSTKDIEYIRYDLRKRGMATDLLLDELTDHVCCEVELEMKSGSAFKTAYEKILVTVNSDLIYDLQNDTIQSENYNPTIMLRNTLKVMFRNMRKHMVHTLINISGLCIGLSCFIIIALYVKHEVSFDRRFSRSSDIYRITMSSTVGGKTNLIPTSYPTLGPALAERYPDVRQYVRIINYKYSRMVPTMRNGEKIFYEENVIFADSTFFNLFDFPFVSGNPAKALLHPNSVVLTERMAEKYFGDENPLGKHLNINNQTELEVTGVIQDIPSNTHLQFDFVIPMSGIGSSGVFRNARVLDSWQTDWFWTYLAIPNKTAIPLVERGLNKLAEEKIADFQKETNAMFYVQSLEDIHLHSNFDYNTDLTQNGDINNLYIFIAVGVLVLLISCINFVNITMATSTRRYKEIGISKVLGALKSQLRMQFVGESTLVCLISLALTSFVLMGMIPLFSSLLGVPLSIQIKDDWPLLVGMTIFTIAIGVLSGAYPAFFVSSFEPQRVLKGIWKPGSGGAYFRKILVGVQVVIAIFLVIGTMIIAAQLDFIKNKSLGYDQDQIIMLPVRGTNMPKTYYAFKSKLLTETSIASVSSVSEPIGREVQFMDFTVEGYKETQFIKILNVTHDFVKTMGLQVLKGRDFSHEFATDSSSGFVINEAAAKNFGWSDPIGKGIDHSFRQIKQGQVIGVVKDFNFEPLQKKIDPIVIWFGGPYWYIAVKAQRGKSAQALQALERRWKEFVPDRPFTFHFLDQSIQHVYEKEERLSQVFLVFSILSILTAVLGLYGLISFVSEQRLTEIGIRKVMGASVKSILYLMSREYALLVMIAFIISAPLTYWIVNQWLENFAFRINWSPFYFVIGLLVSGFIVLATVVTKSWGAAQSNPAEVLRSE